MKKNKSMVPIIVIIITLALIITAVILIVSKSNKGKNSEVAESEIIENNTSEGKTTGSDSNTDENDEEPDPEFRSGMDYGTVSDLVLRLEKGLFSVGSKETVNFTIHCPENAKTIKILDEKGKEVATVENQGEAQVSGSIEINESEPRFGSLHAVSENLESQEIYFTVAPEITEVMLENLGNVCVDIHDYLVTEYPDGKYTDDAPAKIRQFLEQDKRVGNVRIDEKMILFQTIDGLMGMVDTSENEGFVRGTVSKEKAYALSREGQTDEETVIPERSAVTNTRYLYVSPIDDDPIMNYGDVDPREYLEHMASEFGAHYEFIKNDDAETVMKDGSFTNAGFTVLSTHGNTFTRESGGKLLLMSMHNYLDSNIAETQGTKYNEEKEKELLKSLIEHEGAEWYFGSSDHVENCNMILTVSDKMLSPRLTATGLENAIGEKPFDNTVLFLAICFSDEDKHLLQFLADSGVSVIFTGEGEMDVSRCTEMFYMMDSLMTVQNGNGSYPSFDEAGIIPTKEQLKSFWNEWQSITEAEGSNQDWKTLMQDPETNNAAILWKIKTIAQETGTDPISNYLVLRNYKQLWASINKTYNQCKDQLDKKESPEKIMNDYIKGNLVKCYLNTKEKALGGTGSMRGTVLYEKDQVPVQDAEVRVLHWINHDYELAETCKTDSEGHFVTGDLPFGIYAVEATDGAEETHDFIIFTKDINVVPVLYLPINEEDLYYAFLKETYDGKDKDLISAYIMDFDFDGKKDLLTVTKGSVILANTPLGAFDLYKKDVEAATLDLSMYQLDENYTAVKTGAILGAGTIEGHSKGKMSVSIVLQDGKPYICGRSSNEDTTTYGAKPYVIYEVIEGGGFQYDYISGITWGQYSMGTSDDKDPNKIAKTYNLDIRNTQLSGGKEYGVLLCEAEADNIHDPHTFSAVDYTHVKEGLEKGYEAVKEQLNTINEEMVLDAKTFEERQEEAKKTEGLFEIFVNEMDAAGFKPVLKEYKTKENIVMGIYKCKDVTIYVSIENGSGKLIEIELSANGFPVPDSWTGIKDAVLKTSFAGLDQDKIAELLGQKAPNFSIYGFDAGPAKILIGNTGTIVLRADYK